MTQTPLISPDSAIPARRNLEKDPAVIYALDRDLRIVYCNEAWDRFAADNGGRGLERERQLGRSVMDAIPAPLKQFFEQGYQQPLSGRAWEHCFECSSPAVYRSFRMVAYPEPEGAGIVVVNSLMVERLHDGNERSTCIPNETAYTDQHGILTSCCHCRRTRQVQQKSVWDWVPAYVQLPPERVSHAICAVCMNLYYPEYCQPVDEKGTAPPG